MASSAIAPTAELGSRVPRKAKAVLDKLVGSRTMTQSGMEWLVCATDPFHDDRVRCPGYPDLSTVNSVVQTFTTTTSVNAPAGATAPFDVHVPFLPFSAPYATGGLNPVFMDANGYTSTLAPNIVLYPGFNVIVAQNAGTDWQAAPASPALTNSPAIAMPIKYASGHFRLIGAGVEAVNTTAELYKGGALTVYRAPSEPQNGIYISPTTLATSPPATVYPVAPITWLSCPPSTQLEAATYTDSRTWAAEEGAYVIVTQSNLDNPYLSPCPATTGVKKVLDSGTVLADQGAGTTRAAWVSYLVNTGTEFRAPNTGMNLVSPLPFENCGMIFAGLNPNSTLQLTVRYFFERIPATTEPDLLSMAQVPPAFDGTALEIYSRCLGEMPVGVPVAENPLGEWFSSVVDTIASVAPKIGGFLQNIGSAMGGKNITPVQSNATPKRKQQPQQNQNGSNGSNPAKKKRKRKPRNADKKKP